jgi:hypothetical protein
MTHVGGAHLEAAIAHERSTDDSLDIKSALCENAAAQQLPPQAGRVG